MRLRAILADRLAFALLDAEHVDDRRSEQEDEQQRRHDGAAGAERDVAKHVQRTEHVAELDELVEHPSPLVRPLGPGLVQAARSADDF